MEPRIALIVPANGAPRVAPKGIDFRTVSPLEFIDGAKEVEHKALDGFPGYMAGCFFDEDFGRKKLPLNAIASKLCGGTVCGTVVIIDDHRDLGLEDLKTMLNTPAEENRRKQSAEALRVMKEIFAKEKGHHL